MNPISIRKEKAKRVVTRDLAGKENGWLMELFIDKETGTKTDVYLSATLPGAFKGYHLHRVRRARYVCLKGKMNIITYTRTENTWKRQEHILEVGDRFFIPKEVATGLQNVGDEEAWLINYPDPAYDPALKDEQVEYTKEELEAGVVK